MSNACRIGVVSEYQVALEASMRGLGVLHPIGNYHPYDLVLDVNGSLIKVQVKTLRSYKADYRCATRKSYNNKNRAGFEPYSPGDFDFAICLRQEIGLFIIPFYEFTSVNNFCVPSSGKGKNEKYRNAWHLLEEFASNAQRFEQSAFNPHLSEFDSL